MAAAATPGCLKPCAREPTPRNRNFRSSGPGERDTADADARLVRRARIGTWIERAVDLRRRVQRHANGWRTSSRTTTQWWRPRVATMPMTSMIRKGQRLRSSDRTLAPSSDRRSCTPSRLMPLLAGWKSVRTEPARDAAEKSAQADSRPGRWHAHVSSAPRRIHGDRWCSYFKARTLRPETCVSCRESRGSWMMTGTSSSGDPSVGGDQKYTEIRDQQR